MQNYLSNRLSEHRNFDIVAIASSRGGVHALAQVISGLPADFPVPIVIAQHLSPNGRTFLPQILGRKTNLPVKLADDGEPIRPSTVYIAPPDHHLLLNSKESLSLSASPKVNFLRPSADVLFKSVATVYQERALGVVLTGCLYDGSQGSVVIKANGGRVIVQDPKTAEATGMPRAALKTGAVDFMVSLDQIAHTLISLVMIKGIMQLFTGSMPLQNYVG